MFRELTLSALTQGRGLLGVKLRNVTFAVFKYVVHVIAGDRQRETERVEMWRAHWQRDIAAESSVTMLSPQALCGLLAGSGQTGREEGLTSIFAKHRETTNYRQREII